MMTMNSDQKALIDGEHFGLGAAIPQEHHHRAGHAAIERRDGEGEQLGAE